jgi:AP-1 complex subunit beta-1
MSLSRELKEIQEDLNSKKASKKIKAIKKVISYMNLGKNVSSLFFSVMRCLEFNNIEIKKLVYLYIAQYSRDLPEGAIMAINSFIRDVKDQRNSMVRAVAVRTMGCIRVKELNEYLVEPLKKVLEDKDSYVKKTALLTVPKMFEVTPELIKKNGIIELMQKVIKEEKNPVVFAAALDALKEIEEIDDQKYIQLDE